MGLLKESEHENRKVKTQFRHQNKEGYQSWPFYNFYFISFPYLRLKSVLSQDCNWYERQNIEELPTQINVNITEVENATGKTTGFIIYSMGAFIGGICLSFFSGALLAWCYKTQNLCPNFTHWMKYK